MLKNTQSGRSMIEMLGVLAIIGVLSAGGIAGYSMAMKNYKANKASEVVQMVSTQMKTVFNGVYPAGDTVINATNLGKVGITTGDSPFAMTIEGGAGAEGHLPPLAPGGLHPDVRPQRRRRPGPGGYGLFAGGPRPGTDPGGDPCDP